MLLQELVCVESLQRFGFEELAQNFEFIVANRVCESSAYLFGQQRGVHLPEADLIDLNVQGGLQIALQELEQLLESPVVGYLYLLDVHGVLGFV